MPKAKGTAAAKMPQAPNAGGDEGRLFGALAYLPVLQPLVPIVIFLLKKDDSYVKFHSLQALGLFAAFIVCWIGLFAVTMVITLATLGIGGFIMIPLMLLIALGAFCLEIFLMYKAYKGEKYKLPKIGDWAENFR